MPNPGNDFKSAIIEEIISWNQPHIKIYSEVMVGSRFVGAKRKLDLVLQFESRSLGLETKTQQSSGTAYQKLSYAIEDAKRTPIPTLVVFSGDFIQPDVKALLVSSGIGLEVEWSLDNGFGSGVDVLKQRILIELGLDWLSDQKDRLVFPLI